jgi:hypothetical protein
MIEKKKINLSNIITMLNEGVTREGIQDKYSLDKREMKNLFAHPKLKGLRARKANSFEIVDDLDFDPTTGEVDVDPTDGKINSNDMWIGNQPFYNDNDEPITINQQFLFPEMEEVNN